jgi:cytoskeletal protein CcmA (bactofilin family)
MVMSRQQSSGVSSLLGQGSRWEGAVRVVGTLRLDGSCEGTLDVGGMLVIGKTGEFAGEIRARDVVVCGRVRGTILATETVELQKGCHFEGDVHTRTFVVEAGVFFQGTCSMEDPSPGTGVGGPQTSELTEAGARKQPGAEPRVGSGSPNVVVGTGAAPNGAVGVEERRGAGAGAYG